MAHHILPYSRVIRWHDVCYILVPHSPILCSVHQHLFPLHPGQSILNSIFCANHDDFLDRSATPARWHAFEPVLSVLDRTKCLSDDALVLSGRAFLAGGTWLGINKLGRVSFLYALAQFIAQIRSTLTARILPYIKRPSPRPQGHTPRPGARFYRRFSLVQDR
jgi:hypothetical protein